MAQAITYETDTSDMLIPHGLFRSVFATTSAIIDGVPDDDAERAAAVYSYFDNVLRFLDAHHGGEDAVIWPILSERCAEAADLLSRMEDQHAAIHALRDQAGAALETWNAAPGLAGAEELTAALAGLRGELDKHFRQEEDEILPLASRNMSAEEWGVLPGHAMAHFTGDKIWLILGLVFEQMNDEELAFTFTLLPPPVVAMWKTSGKAAFEEFMGRVRPAA